MFSRRKIFFFSQLILLLFLAAVLSACAPKPIPDKNRSNAVPTSLKHGIPVLGQQILNSIPEKKALVLLEPFKEATLYDEIEASADIERLFLGLGRRKKNAAIHLISTADASDKELEEADYILKGVISYSALPDQPSQKYYRILGSLADRKTGTLIARESVWVYSVPYGKLELPVITADPAVRRKVDEVLNQQKISVKDITRDARIAKAKAAYRNKQYARVRKILERLIKSSGKEVLDAYRMLYLASLKMDKYAAAEKAFSKMIRIGFKNTRKMPLLFLFASDSTEFTVSRTREYDIWIRQLVAYLKNKKKKCMHIIGHTSKQGEFQYNMELSEARAMYIKDRLVREAALPAIGKRITVKGKGETATKVGSEPDSDQNMIDRRVEFELFNCSG